MIISEDIESITKEELADLWFSVGWMHEYKNINRVSKALKNSTKGWAVRDGHKLVGILTSLSDGWNAYISYLVVHGEYQGFGVGTALLGKFKEHYKDCKMLLLTGSASGFYENHGFRDIRHGMLMNGYLPENVSVSTLKYISEDGCRFSKMSDCLEWGKRKT